MPEKAQFKCNECGKFFNKSIGRNTMEVKCPGCHGVDTEPTGTGYGVSLTPRTPMVPHYLGPYQQYRERTSE